jgi:signal transduction histidine kinase
MNEPDTIFAIEQQVLRHAQAVLKAADDHAHPLWHEFQTLLNSYERMYTQMDRLIRLSDRQQLQLKQANERIAAQNAQLARQNAALQEVAQLREDVEHITQHDLKSPLTTILGIAQLLRLNPALPESLANSIQMLEEAGLLMLNMINLSLDLLKIERGEYPIHPVPVNLVGLIRKIMLVFEPLHVAKRLSCTVVSASQPNLDQPPILAVGEELLCYTLLANLLKNALEASPEGEPITITLDPQPETVHLRIHNQGTVPEPIRERFFQKYNTYGKAQGTGLGAYSAKIFTEVQGGTITMQTSEAKGTTLTVCLPASHEPLTANPPSQLLSGMYAIRAPWLNNETEMSSAPPQSFSTQDQSYTSVLAQLPPVLFDSLRDAVQALNVAVLEELLPQLHQHSPTCAAYFREKSQHYRFDLLQALFER